MNLVMSLMFVGGGAAAVWAGITNPQGGPGIELQYRRNMTLRADWGIAGRDAGTAKSGDNRVHFALTIVY